MKLTLHTYRLPFRKPFRTGGETWSERRGVLLSAEHRGITAWGEAAPLPGFSHETVEQIVVQCRKLSDPLRELLSGAENLEELNRGYHRHRIVPSLRFAADTLWTALRSREKGISPGELLYSESLNRVPVNAVLPLEDPEVTRKEAEKRISEGYRTLKLKAGRDGNRLFRTVGAVREIDPSVAIRIDANRGWSLPEASEHLNRLEPLDIEYCEEPLSEGSTDNYRRLVSESDVPLAADEMLAGSDFDPDILSYMKVMILKPMVIGSFFNLFATKALADDHDIKAVVTTALEGGIGRTVTAVLAGGIGSPGMAHGLATGRVLKTDLCDDPLPVQRGTVDPAAVRTLPEVNYGTLKDNIIDSIAL